MKTSEYARMAEYEQTYWWHLGRLKIIETYLKKAHKKPENAKILNVGCGTGGTLPTLEKFGEVDNVDISDEALKFMKERGYSNRLFKVEDIKLPFQDKTYDIVGAFDVLEHIKDQVGALKEWHRVLKDDGAIVLTVPAYQWLWTSHDDSLYHERRYTTKRLEQAAKEAGLRAQKRSYAVVFSLPLVVGFRFLNKALGRKMDAETSYVNVPGSVNKLFTNILSGEAKLHSKLNFPAGTSVVAILRKAK